METWGARRIGAYAVAAILLILLVQRFLLIELVVRRCGLPLLAASIVALAMIGCGWAAGRTRDLATALLVGYPIFGTICFLVALLRVNRVTMAVPAIALAIAGCFCVAPAIQLDEVAYHLAVPWEWVKEGRAVALPLISHSFFPLGTESADLPLLAFLGSMQGGIASHFLHLLAAIATAAVALRIANGDWLVTAAVVSTPALAITAGWAQADWPLLGIALVLMRAVHDQDDRLQAAAIGAGLLTKYTFLPIIAIAAFVSRRWRPVAIGVAIGCVFFIRNLILTGSPVAPFLTAASPHVSAYRQLSIAGYVFDPAWLDEALGVNLFALPLLASGLFAGLTAAVAVILLLALTPSARIVAPFLAIPALTARVDSRVMRGLLIATTTVQIFIAALFINSSGPFDLLSGRASDEEFVARNRASFAASRWIDAQLPPKSRALIIGVNETYWFETPVRGSGNFDSERMSRYLTDPANIAHDRMTHVAIMAQRRRNDATKAEERAAVLTPEAQRALARLLSEHAEMIGAREDARLYQLK